MPIKAVAIFGYNNTRLYDVVKIKKLLQSHHLDIVLCKEGITEADREVSGFCFDVKLQGTAEEIEKYGQEFTQWISGKDIEIMGILPFSDKGVLLGSYVATQLDT